MAVSIAALTAGIVLACVALLVLVLRKPGRETVATASLLALWGAATVANALMSGATDATRAMMYARLAIWYSIPLPLFILLVATSTATLSRASRSALLALTGVTLGALGAFGLSPHLFVTGVGAFGRGHGILSGPLLYLLAIALVASQAAVAYLASERARALETGSLPGSRARLLALAFGIMPVHAAGFFVAFSAAGAPDADLLYWSRAAPTVLAGGTALWALARLGRAPMVAVLVALVLGLVDGLAGAQILRGAFIPGYERNAVVIRIVFALALAVAVLRFGLGDAGRGERRHVERVGRVVVGGAAVALGGALAYFALGATPLALGIGVLVGAAVPLALREPVGAAGRAFAARVLLPPDDPRAVAERARRYAAAVAASRDAGPEGERFLAQMRADLGVTEREHALLAQGLASREAERYRRVETLGRGATAQVELAVDEVAGRRVVVKRFKGLRNPAAVLREARALAAVRHPRVVPFLEVDRRDDEVFLVLAYAEGGSAREALDRDGPMPAGRAVALTLDLLDGLAALHAQGVVHCDVKPENLLLDAEGRGMLGDFGSARWLPGGVPDLVDSTLTGGAAEGSLSTISPEALRNAPPAPPRDVYAAGALLYRLLAGQHYVDLGHATVFQARERITLDRPRLPHPRVPAAIEPVLRKALAKRPEDRYRDASEMRDALAAAWKAIAPP